MHYKQTKTLQMDDSTILNSSTSNDIIPAVKNVEVVLKVGPNLDNLEAAFGSRYRLD